MTKTTLFLLLLLPVFVSAETIAIIGTGNVGMALGTEFAAQGHTIIYGSRSPDSLKAQDLVDKTGEGTSAMLPVDAAQASDVVVLAVPGMVVEDVAKAFNTINWQQMIDPETAKGPLSVPLTGDHDLAKAFVAELASKMGLEPIDIGPLEYSRWSEFATVVFLNNQFSKRQRFSIHLRPAE